MKKHFYQQPLIVVTVLSTVDTVMASGFGDNQVDDDDII